MTLSTSETHDPNGSPLRFRWTLLRGDSERVQIEPLDDRASRVRITLNWHQARTLDIVPNRTPSAPLDKKGRKKPEAAASMSTSRVDIGVFATNGAQDSAPALISISFPTHETRRYAQGTDGTVRLLSVDYDAISRKTKYDPALHWSAPWTDHLVLDRAGQPIGWTRQEAGRTVQLDLFGQPVDGSKLDYRINREKPAHPVLTAIPSLTVTPGHQALP